MLTVAKDEKNLVEGFVRVNGGTFSDGSPPSFFEGNFDSGEMYYVVLANYGVLILTPMSVTGGDNDSFFIQVSFSSLAEALHFFLTEVKSIRKVEDIKSQGFVEWYISPF